MSIEYASTEIHKESNKPSTMSSDTVSIKFVLGEEVRRIGVPRNASWSEFDSLLKSVFGDAAKSFSLLQYRDAEGDLVSVTSEVELRELLSHAATSDAVKRVHISTDAPAPERDWEVVDADSKIDVDAEPVPVAEPAEAKDAENAEDADKDSDKDAEEDADEERESSISPAVDVDDEVAEKQEDAEESAEPATESAVAPAETDKPVESAKRKRSPFSTLFETLRDELDAFSKAFDEYEEQEQDHEEDHEEQEQEQEHESESESEEEEDDDELEWVRHSLLSQIRRAQLLDHYRLQALEAERARRRRLAQLYYARAHNPFAPRYVMSSAPRYVGWAW